MKKSYTYYVLCLEIIVFVISIIYFNLQLPTTIAVHFNMIGEPNGWQDKDEFFWIITMLIVGIGSLFFGIPKIIRKLPLSLINLPNKAYRFSPEHSEQTLAWLDRAFFQWGVMMTGMLISFFMVVCYSNLTIPVQLSLSIFMPTISMFVFLFGIIILSLFSKFNKIPN